MRSRPVASLPVALARLEELLEDLWAHHARSLPGGVPMHRIRFSRRLTESWALIYYRRREVRLSPYVFLLPRRQLRHGSDWGELAASVLHELAHAHVWAATGDPGHPPVFARRLSELGVDPNGERDLGPTNPTWRYRYACTVCDRRLLRRLPLRGPTSCARCGPPRYHPGHRMVLEARLPAPWTRLAATLPRILAALEEGEERARMVDPRLTVARISRRLADPLPVIARARAAPRAGMKDSAPRR